MLCTSDAALQEELVALLACTGSKVALATTQMEAIKALDQGSLHLMVVDVRLRGALSLLDLSLACIPTVAITSGQDLETLSSLVCTIGVSNVVARPHDSDNSMVELLITVEKLLRNDLFGLDKYMHGLDSQVYESVLTRANDRDTQIGQLSSFLQGLKVPKHLLATIANAADEMLTNAMYNAPVDDTGKPLYAATNRRSKIQLAPTEHVAFSYGVREGIFGISVSDQFGRLRLSHLSKSIERCVGSEDPIEQKAGGAGLGLFLIARTAHQFVINVDPDERTEVIALWDLDRKRLREKRAYHSLHYFERTYQPGPRPRPRRASGTSAPHSDWDDSSTNPGIN